MSTSHSLLLSLSLSSLSLSFFLSFSLMRYFLIRHSKWRSMTTCHTSRKGFLSLLRRPSPSSFSYVILHSRGTSTRYIHCMPPFTYPLLSMLWFYHSFLFLHASYSLPLSSIVFFRRVARFRLPHRATARREKEKKSFVAWVTIGGDGDETCSVHIFPWILPKRPSIAYETVRGNRRAMLRKLLLVKKKI